MGFQKCLVMFHHAQSAITSLQCFIQLRQVIQCGKGR